MGEIFQYAMRSMVKDRLTGFEGVVIARADYLCDANSYLVQPRPLDDGKMIESKWISEARIELTGTASFNLGPPA